MITNMAQYETSKIVNAGKIDSITLDSKGGFRVDYFDKDNRPAWTHVSWAWQTKHQARPGWYLVQYQDGYLSATPPEPFEDAATRIDNN